MGQILSLTPIQSETLQDSSLWETRQTKFVYCENFFRKIIKDYRVRLILLRGDKRSSKLQCYVQLTPSFHHNAVKRCRPLFSIANYKFCLANQSTPSKNNKEKCPKCLNLRLPGEINS